MRWILPLLLLVFSGSALAAGLPRVEADKKLILPEALTTLIAGRFPDHRIPVANDFHPSPEGDSALANKPVLDLWYAPDWGPLLSTDEVPWACWGDFNGDSLTDVALILIPKAAGFANPNPGGANPKLVVFHQTQDGYALLEPWPKFPPEWWHYAIKTMPPGKIPPMWAGNQPREYEIPTRFDSIEWYMYGSSSCRLYWEDGAYKQAWTGD